MLEKRFVETYLALSNHVETSMLLCLPQPNCKQLLMGHGPQLCTLETEGIN